MTTNFGPNVAKQPPNIDYGTTIGSIPNVGNPAPMTSVSIPSSPSNSNRGAGFIAMVDDALVMKDGAQVSVYGSGFLPNSVGALKSDTFNLSPYTADTTGHFVINLTYVSKPPSQLALAVARAVAQNMNYCNVVAVDSQTMARSNDTWVYF